MKFAAGARIAVMRPDAVAVPAQVVVSLATEVTRLLVANVSSGAAMFRLYHSRDAVVDENDALLYDVSVPAGEFFNWGADVGSGLHLRPGDRLAFRSSVASALVCHAYGVTASIAPEVS